VPSATPDASATSFIWIWSKVRRRDSTNAASMIRSRRTSWDWLSWLGRRAVAVRARLTVDRPGPRAGPAIEPGSYETAFRPMERPLSWVVVDKLK